jgi:hypothetical protein
MAAITRQQQYDQHDERLEKHDELFQDVLTRMTRVETHLEHLATRQGQQEADIRAIRLEQETDIRAIRLEFSKLTTTFEGFRTRFNAIQWLGGFAATLTIAYLSQHFLK